LSYTRNLLWLAYRVERRRANRFTPANAAAGLPPRRATES